MQINELIGKNVFVRTRTHDFTGRLTELGRLNIGDTNDPQMHSAFLKLEDAALVNVGSGGTTKASEALINGRFSDIQPYPQETFVNVGAVVDISPWLHTLPGSNPS